MCRFISNNSHVGYYLDICAFVNKEQDTTFFSVGLLC